MRIKFIKPLQNFCLEIKFEDGLSGIISIKDQMFGPAFEALKDPDYFKKVFISDSGVCTWPNETDLAPEFLYERINSNQTKRKKVA